MTDTLEADIPDSEEAIQETRTPEQRRQDLLQERIDKATGVEDEPEPEAPETEDEEGDEEEVEAPEVDEDEEEESEDESEDVPSDDGGFDIEDLDEDELEALTQQVASKAGKALTKARLQDKERKAEIEKLQEQVQELSANVVTSDNPRSEDPGQIIAQIVDGLKQPDRAIVLEDRAAAIAWAIREASTDDIILIAGKGHENYQIIGTERIDLSDYGAALANLAKRAEGVS